MIAADSNNKTNKNKTIGKKSHTSTKKIVTANNQKLKTHKLKSENNRAGKHTSPTAEDYFSPKPTDRVVSSRSIWIKALLATALFFLIFVIASCLLLGVIVWQYSQQFLQAAQITRTELWQTISEAKNLPSMDDDRLLNILVLGTDDVVNRPNDPLLTDTILLAQLHPSRGEFRLVSLPRDLWSAEYQTRINALYFYGQQRNPNNPLSFPTQVIGELTQIPIEHTIVVSLNDLATIVDLLGGIEIDVPQGFTDTQFPRDDVDIETESDPAVLYKTITFAAGKQLMHGQQVLEYVRSRHSDDLSAGTDIARGERQQLVVAAIANRILSVHSLSNPTILGNLYRFYLNKYQQQLPMSTIVMAAKTMWEKQTSVNFQTISLPIFPDVENGVIYHPNPLTTAGQWVYVVRSPQLFQEFFQQNFNRLNNAN